MDLPGIYKEFKRSGNPMIQTLKEQYEEYSSKPNPTKDAHLEATVDEVREDFAGIPSSVSHKSSPNNDKIVATCYTITIQSTIEGEDFWFSNNVASEQIVFSKEETKQAAIKVIQDLEKKNKSNNSTSSSKVPDQQKISLQSLLYLMKNQSFDLTENKFYTAHYEDSILDERLRKTIAKTAGGYCVSGHFYDPGTSNTLLTVFIQPNNPKHYSETFHSSMHKVSGSSTLATHKPGLQFIMDDILGESDPKIFDGNVDFRHTVRNFSDHQGSYQVVKYLHKEHPNLGAPHTVHSYRCVDGFISPSITDSNRSTRPSWMKPHKKTNVNITYILADISFANGTRMVLLFTCNAPIKPFTLITDKPRKGKSERLEDTIKIAFERALQSKFGKMRNVPGKKNKQLSLTTLAKQPAEVVPMAADTSKKPKRKQTVADTPMSTYTEALDQISNGSIQCKALFKKGFTPIPGFTERDKW